MYKFMLLSLAMVIGIVSIYIGFLFNSDTLLSGYKFESSGVFGDSWGALTSVFSMLGFFGVAYTLKLQHQSISRLEKENLKKQYTDEIRDFEHSFFNMLNLLQIIINDMKVIIVKRDKIEGRSVFLYFFNNFKREFNSNNFQESLSYKNEESLDKISSKIGYSYTKYFESRSQNLSHYYRFIYGIFKFIDESNIKEKHKIKYSKILRAQISNYELLMIFYNSLTDDGENFKYFLERYAILDNLPVLKLINKEHVLLVSKISWGKNERAIKIFTEREFNQKN